jgi:hypothetical protein
VQYEGIGQHVAVRALGRRRCRFHVSTTTSPAVGSSGRRQGVSWWGIDSGGPGRCWVSERMTASGSVCSNTEPPYGRPPATLTPGLRNNRRVYGRFPCGRSRRERLLPDAGGFEVTGVPEDLLSAGPAAMLGA